VLITPEAALVAGNDIHEPDKLLEWLHVKINSLPRKKQVIITLEAALVTGNGIHETDELMSGYM
jgi:hypothetical protein